MKIGVTSAGPAIDDTVEARFGRGPYVLIIDQDTLSVKPKCHKKAERIISLCRFELKGGGWFADGYSSRKSHRYDTKNTE